MKRLTTNINDMLAQRAIEGRAVYTPPRVETPRPTTRAINLDTRKFIDITDTCNLQEHGK